MRIAYIILAHKNPKQLKALIKSLEYDESMFFVHIDKRVDITPFVEELKGLNVFWVNREITSWGSIGLVKATINGMNDFMWTNAEYMILLSGQDYPIKSNKYIHEFFSKNIKSNFIYYFNLPGAWGKEGIDRISKYHNVRVRHSLIKLFPRIIPYGLTTYGGSQWLNLNRMGMDSILSFLNNHPKYLKFHQYTRIPDELFFQTILLNSYFGIINNDLRYCDWSDGKNPKILNEGDMDKLKESSALFARKFEDSSLYSIINERMRNV